jgi:hypothetical protein
MLSSSASAEDIIPVSPPDGQKLATVKIFSSKDNAEVFSETLKSKGFDVEVTEVTTKDKETIYRVSGKKHPESLKEALSSEKVEDIEKPSPDTISDSSRKRRQALVILSPRDRAELRIVDKITFSWLSVPQASEYHVILAKDRDLKDVINEAAHVTGTSYTVDGLDYGTYFFKINSRLSDNTEGPSSEILSFVIVPPQPLTDPLYFLDSDSS